MNSKINKTKNKALFQKNEIKMNLLTVTMAT